MDPTERYSAVEALAHPYVAKFSDPLDEVCHFSNAIFITDFILLYSQQVELCIMEILRQSKLILRRGRVEFPSQGCAMLLLINWYVGMIFEEIGSFQQQTDLYKQKLGFECRQSGPITFQN